MVGVAADFLEVVVLAADADALLRVRRADVVPLAGAKEDVLELVHPGVGEQQGGVAVGDHRGAGNDAVAVLCKEIKETLADLVSFHHTSICVISWISSRMPLTSTQRIISPENTIARPRVWTSQARASAFSWEQRGRLDELGDHFVERMDIVVEQDHLCRLLHLNVLIRLRLFEPEGVGGHGFKSVLSQNNMKKQACFAMHHLRVDSALCILRHIIQYHRTSSEDITHDP